MNLVTDWEFHLRKEVLAAAWEPILSFVGEDANAPYIKSEDSRKLARKVCATIAILNEEAPDLVASISPEKRARALESAAIHKGIRRVANEKLVALNEESALLVSRGKSPSSLLLEKINLLIRWREDPSLCFS